MKKDDLAKEGLAAQLYVASKSGGPYVWWHLLRESVKVKFRKEADGQIAEYNRNDPFKDHTS